jgi:EAL domain-containing protein (putative c-di-GMP-specific phosphodiesterase class I)/GGDEF domain-containing protein
MDIETMFHLAEKADRLWDLESLCRSKVLAHLGRKPRLKKLFLNVNPNIINDEKFKNGLTRQFLFDYGAETDEIVFELTERVAIMDMNVFLQSVAHYRNQNFSIAIDDMGSGFSGLNTIVNIQPEFVKLDMNLVRHIDKDNIKISLCRAFREFCHSENINLIAEGIETEAALKTLIQLGVQYGQGYFLAPPEEDFREKVEAADLISSFYAKHYIEPAAASVYPIIGHLAKLRRTFPPETKAVEVFEIIKDNPTITEICVVENEKIVGFLSRTALNDYFGGRYGYSLHCKKRIKELMSTSFLKVPYSLPVDAASRRAMQRPYEKIYNPIVVEKHGLFQGVVTVKDLLETSTKVQLDVAIHSNPLTGLPGNLLIEKEIKSRLFGVRPFCITYYDLDNFKSYNDAYGFANGDLMLKLVSDLLRKYAKKNEFLGHIGGDDFIVIADYHDGESFCRPLLDDFSREIQALYREDDINQGFIVSKNRHGVTENFPLASLSAAGLTNRKKSYATLDDFSKDAARLKKICKQHSGNYFEIW